MMNATVCHFWITSRSLWDGAAFPDLKAPLATLGLWVAFSPRQVASARVVGTGPEADDRNGKSSGELASNQMSSNLIPIAKLSGRVVTHWQGGEMALSEGCGLGGVRWEDASIPFLQLVKLDLQFADGDVFRLLSQIEDGTGFHGFYLVKLNNLAAPRPFDDPLSIFRERMLPELPLGEIEIAQLRHDGPNAIVEVRLLVSGTEIRMLAAEVQEYKDGSLSIVEPAESILIQVNGVRPSCAQ